MSAQESAKLFRRDVFIFVHGFPEIRHVHNEAEGWMPETANPEEAVGVAFMFHPDGMERNEWEVMVRGDGLPFFCVWGIACVIIAKFHGGVLIVPGILFDLIVFPLSHQESSLFVFQPTNAARHSLKINFQQQVWYCVIGLCMLS